jgi:hypothetical protein
MRKGIVITASRAGHSNAHARTTRADNPGGNRAAVRSFLAARAKGFLLG